MNAQPARAPESDLGRRIRTATEDVEQHLDTLRRLPISLATSSRVKAEADYLASAIDKINLQRGTPK